MLVQVVLVIIGAIIVVVAALGILYALFTDWERP